ncbi:MAG TPA: DUF2336 domain-containing protein [Pseudolabrys sp.]|nr:DUF2336 domain-containing protein [Pseudolabrys sp.]
MTAVVESLLTEIDAVLDKVSDQRHLLMLRQVTELFLAHAGSCTEDQVAIFDAVIARLSRDIGRHGQAELAARLAAMQDAPSDTIGQLSNSDDIAVAGPLLERSSALTDDDLAGIAQKKSQRHLLAIAGRAHINDSVTDVLVDRGDAKVRYKVIDNEGARFSESGFARLVTAASVDKQLAAKVAKRPDVPPELQPFLQVALG